MLQESVTVFIDRVAIVCCSIRSRFQNQMSFKDAIIPLSHNIISLLRNL